ncbi:MAG: hypothetical protein AB7J13_01160 [Pyrinomonadaceae bacterium]
MNTIGKSGKFFSPERWGFLEVEFETLLDAVAAWTKSLFFDVHMIPVGNDLAAMMLLVEDRTVPMERYLLTTTQSGWVACFSNSLGGDVTSLVGYMSETLYCAGVEIVAVPSQGKLRPGQVHYPACQFTLYSGKVINCSNVERSVVCMDDGGRWIFETDGQVQSFEETNKYSEPRIRDRFTIDMLERYCRALGIDPFERSFYGERGLLFRFSNPI